MVTQQDLLEYIGRRPFQPFRVTLSGGETVDVTRTAQAVAMSRPMVVATPDNRRLRWIQLETR
jgi:hypothetical protein